MERFECLLDRELSRHELVGSTPDDNRTIIVSEAIEVVIEAADGHAACSAFADRFGGNLPESVNGLPVWACESCGVALIDGDGFITDEDGSRYCMPCCEEIKAGAEQDAEWDEDVALDEFPA